MRIVHDYDYALGDGAFLTLFRGDRYKAVSEHGWYVEVNVGSVRVPVPRAYFEWDDGKEGGRK